MNIPRWIALIFGLWLPYPLFGQTIFVQPHSDSIYFDSDLFRPEKGHPIYMWSSDSYSRELDAFHHCGYLLRIKRIKPYIISEEMRQDELYRPYEFDRFVEVDTLRTICGWVPKSVTYSASSFYAMTNLVVQFSNQPKLIELDQGEKVISRNDTVFDFLERKMKTPQFVGDIIEFGYFTSYYAKSNPQTFYRLLVSRGESITYGYSLIVEEGKIVLIYCWMQPRGNWLMYLLYQFFPGNGSD